MNSALSIRDVSIAYGRERIIDNLSLEVRAGETLGLIGLNGAGKTSLIKAVLGLRDLQAGEVAIFGESHTLLESKSRMAFLPERFTPPRFLTGLEFLRFSYEIYGRRFDEQHALAEAGKLSLSAAVLRRRVQTYSKGMRQKLGLLGAVLPGCELLILDEPMSGLDVAARNLVKTMLRDQHMRGRTVFFTSHNMADMEELCGRIAVLEGGAIRFAGPTGDLMGQTGCDTLERAFLQLIEKMEAA